MGGLKLAIPFDNPTTYAGHSGIDYPVPRGTLIPASGPGRVTWRGWNPVGGYFIWVKYDTITPEVGYHHMDSHNGCPAEGTRVDEGTRLGYCGNSGHSTGPHVHSEVAGHRTTDGYWRFFDRSRVVGQSSGGNAAGIEDDMTPEQNNKLNAIYAALFGNRNNTGKADPISWVNIGGDKQTSNYGVLPIVIHNQTLIAQQASRIAALEALIKKQS